jgi:hypothetical protein
VEHVQCAWTIDKSFYIPLPRPEFSPIVIHTSIVRGNGWVTTVWIFHVAAVSSTTHRQNTMKRPPLRMPPLNAVITRQVHQKVVFYCHLTHARLTRSVNDNNHSPVGIACHLQHTHIHTYIYATNPTLYKKQITKSPSASNPSTRPFNYWQCQKTA